MDYVLEGVTNAPSTRRRTFSGLVAPQRRRQESIRQILIANRP